MKFNKMIAVVAMISLAVQANAQDGTLRRVAQNDTVNTEAAGENQTKQDQAQAAQAQQSVTVTTTVMPTPAAAEQPATVVEAQPVVESKAEQLRKARQSAEIQTEQKIVEKLEEERLREEQQRAERLFGTALSAEQAAALKAAAEAPAQKIDPAQTVVPVAPAPVANTAPQVTIEKVEIIQPPVAPVAPPEVKSITAEKEVVRAAVVAPAPVAKSSLSAADLEEEEDVKGSQLYVSGSLGGLNYNADNVKSNFGGGFAVGTLVNERAAIEASFLYSNHFIDTFWNPGIFRELDQYDIGLKAKYYILNERIKPYIGAGASYIIRNYSQRIVSTNQYGQTSTSDGPSEDQTESVNVMALAGADFQINEMFMLGAGFEYSANVMNRNEFDFQNYYATLPENTKALEEIEFWTLKVTGTLTF